MAYACFGTREFGKVMSADCLAWVSIWLGPGSDPKVVQRILGHATDLSRLRVKVRGAKMCSDLRKVVEPPVGIEPTTFSLRVRRSTD